MQGFSLNNISDCYVGATGASAIYYGSTCIWQRQTYTWVTLPQYHHHTSLNIDVPNAASISSINGTTCHLVMPTHYDFTYVLDPDTSSTYRNLNYLYYEFDITGVDNVDITLTTNFIPTGDPNLFKTSRVSGVTSAVTSLQSGKYTFEDGTSTIKTGFLTKSTTWTYNSSSLNPSTTYHFSLFYIIDENGRDYDYFYQANNTSPGIEVTINTTI